MTYIVLGALAAWAGATALVIAFMRAAGPPCERCSRHPEWETEIGGRE